MKRIYLDHAAATPMDSRVVATMQQFDTDTFANPSAIHKEGVATKMALEAGETVKFIEFYNRHKPKAN